MEKLKYSFFIHIKIYNIVNIIQNPFNIILSMSPLSKEFFNDLSIIVPFRRDVPEREENLRILLFFLQELKGSRILILEADSREQLFDLPDKVEKIFLTDHSSLFHRTRYVNEILHHITTPYLAVWDNDVLIPFRQTAKAYSLLQQNTDIVIPYNGTTLNIPGSLRREIIRRPGSLDTVREEGSNMFGHFSVGGIFFIQTALYRQSGGENEYIRGWGPEDLERVKRWEILNYRLRFLEDPLFHLSHSRSSDNYRQSASLTAQNQKELLKVCSMNTPELENYITSWPWLPFLYPPETLPGKQ